MGLLAFPDVVFLLYLFGFYLPIIWLFCLVFGYVKPTVSLPPTPRSTPSGRHIYAFLGVPYGRVPVRFARAVDPEPWEGVFSAREFVDCVQVRERGGGMFHTFDTDEKMRNRFADLGFEKKNVRRKLERTA